MKGVCFRSVGRVTVEDLADPMIQTPRDAIVRIELAGLCGSDLHPFFGREVGLDPGTVMGHEFVAKSSQSQREFIRFAQVIVYAPPFTTNCGSCFYCNCGLTARCSSGQLLDGDQTTLVCMDAKPRWYVCR